MDFINDINNAYSNLEVFLMDAGIWTVIISSLLVFLESIFAFLPLCVFINTNIIGAGPVLGIILSWIFTTIGSYTVFLLCRKGFSKWFSKYFMGKPKVKKFMDKVSSLRFRQLVILISIPFTPSFFVNLGLGLSKVSPKKFLYALIIGKIFVVIFWGYIGMKLIECLTNPWAFLKVIGMGLAAYIIALIVNKKFDIDGRF